MRVLILTGEYPPRTGGVGDYSAHLAAALRDQGQAVQVLTSAESDLDDDDLVAPPAWRRVPNWGFGSWPRVVAALTDWRADLLHIQYQPGAFQLKGAVHLLPLWLRARRPGLRVVTTFHDLRVPYLFPKAGPLRQLAVRMLLQGSQSAIFVDPSDLAHVGAASNRRWIPIGSNIPCAPPAGYDRVALRAQLGVEPGGLLVGYFGFLTAGKGVTTLLRAIRLLRDGGYPARLVLIGAGANAGSATDQSDQHTALALGQELGLGPWLRLTGLLTPPAVSAHLLACDAVALPYDEGASFRRGSLLAALEHGCPVVTTAPARTALGSGLRRLEPDRQFLVVPPGAPAALAEAVMRLAHDPVLAANLGAAGRALAERCGWPALASEVAAVYAESGLLST
jgi:glycosyltransferase involved in cell wall biosynthesis